MNNKEEIKKYGIVVETKNVYRRIKGINYIADIKSLVIAHIENEELKYIEIPRENIYLEQMPIYEGNVFEFFKRDSITKKQYIRKIQTPKYNSDIYKIAKKHAQNTGVDKIDPIFWMSLKIWDKDKILTK